jgi:hypothetical protein
VKRFYSYQSILNFINTYSILVAIGSLSSYLFFSNLFNVKPNYVLALGLSLSLWIIYTLDHLLDGLSIGKEASSIRHREHFLKHKQIIRWILSGLIILIGLSFWVPQVYYGYVLFLCILTLLHFCINYFLSRKYTFLRYLKEIFVALVVTIGFVITPLIGNEESLNLTQLIYIFIIFYFINLSNLLIFSFFDQDRDLRDKMLTIAHLYSYSKLRRLIYLGIGISMIILVIGYINCHLTSISFFVFASMQLTLLFITSFPSYFKFIDRYRFFGDLIYLYPIVVFPFLG